MSGIRLKAILLGLLTDVTGSVLVGLALGALMAVMAAASGDTSRNHLAALLANPVVKLVGLAGTTFSTALGGYVASRLSRANGIQNSLAVGVLSIVLAVALAVLRPGVTPAWKLALGVVVTIPAALLGGRLATRTEVDMRGVQ